MSPQVGTGLVGKRVAVAVIHAEAALLPAGLAHDVRIEVVDGLVRHVRPDAPAQAGDERHAFVVPGVGNLHSHAFQRAMAGLAETRGPGEDSFWSWRAAMYRIALAMTPDHVEAVAAQLYMEMLEAGFTRVGEFHYLHHAPDGSAYADPAEMAGRIAAAAAEAGIGLTLLPVFYAHGGFGGSEPAEGQRRFVSGLDLYARLLERSAAILAPLPGAALGLAPHSLRAVAPGELAALQGLAEGRPIHIHVAEQTREVEDCLAWSGARPVEWLLDHAPVDGRWCLVHATHMTPAETRRLASSGATVGLCPITEANLGDGIFPAADFLRHGGSFGVGSDSHVRVGLAEELRTLEYSQRLALRRRAVIASSGSTGLTLLGEAARGGARALGGAGGDVAGLAAGAPADLVGLDTSAVPWLEAGQVLDGFVFADGVRVDAVWARGDKLVEHGRHRHRDAISARFRDAMTDLATTTDLAKMRDLATATDPATGRRA